MTALSDPTNVLPFQAKWPVTSSIVPVDPATATEWLARNHNNRRIRRLVVDAYARDMIAGRWQLTGEAIKFAEDGTLLDGQHRLCAVVQSGCTVQMFVISGLSCHTREVMDTGSRRTTADALKMDGHPNSVALAAAGRMAIRFERGETDARTRGQGITNSEIMAWIADHPSIYEAVQVGTTTGKPIPVSHGVLGYAIWKLRNIDAIAAVEFIEQVAVQDNIPANDPRAVLGRRLIAMKTSKTVDTPAAYLDLIFRAWNRWREGGTASVFRIYRLANQRVVPTEPR